MNMRLTHSALAAGLLTLLAASAGHAQAVLLTAPPAGFAATPTAQYPDNNGFVKGPFTVAVGDNTATFTAAHPGANSFEAFKNFDGSVDFPIDTIVINTFDAVTQTVTGPVTVSFGTGVGAFGLNVESARDDTAIFSFTTYNGATAIGTFTLPPVTQSEPPSNHHSVFLGAQTLGADQITSVVISDTSLAGGTDTSGTNDFFFGPLSTFAPVPEASTTVSFGLLMLLGLGGAVIAARKKSGSAKASA